MKVKEVFKLLKGYEDYEICINKTDNFRISLDELSFIVDEPNTIIIDV